MSSKPIWDHRVWLSLSRIERKAYLKTLFTYLLSRYKKKRLWRPLGFNSMNQLNKFLQYLD